MAATGACLGALCCWSIGPIFIEYLTGVMDSWTQNALRYTVACVFWLPFLFYWMARGSFDRRTWRVAILPAAANVVMQSLWVAGFYYIGPAFATLLAKTSVLWVAGFSLIFFAEERPLARSPRFWAGFALSLTGLFGVIAFKEDFTTAGTQVGIIITLMHAVMWAVYTISVKVAFRRVDSRIGFSVISIYTVIGLWLCTALFGRPERALDLGVGPWAAVVFSGITAIALGHVFYYAAIKRIGATIPALVILVQPLVVLSMSSIVFLERFTIVQLLFGLLLLAGMALSIWAQQHLRAAPDDGATGATPPRSSQPCPPCTEPPGRSGPR